jgi:hypothetical protein
VVVVLRSFLSITLPSFSSFVEQKWLPAEVVNVDAKANSVKVHFVGYTAKFDEKIARNSERLAE